MSYICSHQQFVSYFPFRGSRVGPRLPGICIQKDPAAKTIHMTQTSLIESVLQDLNLFQITNKKTHHPLAIFTQIRKELHVKPSWNYYLVIGKLNYIAQNTCPDISFVIHQCAHCSCNPIALHVLAMKCIGCYRIGNIWNLENMLSRSAGYIYTNCGCPIHWASKLQSENCTFHGKT